MIYYTVSILYYYNIYALYIIQCPYNIYIHGTVLNSNTGTLPTTGSLRLVGSLHSYVSFAEYRLFYRALFAKETCNFKEPTSRSHPIVLSSDTGTVPTTAVHICIIYLKMSIQALCVTLWGGYMQ